MGEGSPGLTDLRYVGPATAAVLRIADVSAADVVERYVDHETLVEAGVNPGVAARIRREHSLAWSHSTGGDLARRAEQIGGLGEAERAWVTASAGDWEDADRPPTPEPSEPPERTGAAWRERSERAGSEAAVSDGDRDGPTREPPTPVTELDGVDAETARRLAEAGVTSVRALAVSDAEGIASSLDLDPEAVGAWQRAAREHRVDG